jgi:hypothetical protein
MDSLRNDKDLQNQPKKQGKFEPFALVMKVKIYFIDTNYDIPLFDYDCLQVGILWKY